MSYTVVSKADLLYACDSYIEDRKRYIDRYTEKLIENEMQPRKLFGFVIGRKTRYQAIRELEKFSDEYSMRNMIAWKEYEQIQKLRSICLLPGPEAVKLSADHADILVGHFEKNGG